MDVDAVVAVLGPLRPLARRIALAAPLLDDLAHHLVRELFLGALLELRRRGSARESGSVCSLHYHNLECDSYQ